MKKAAEFLAPDCVLIHEDHDPVHGAKAFIEVWQKNLDKMPHYHKDIKDIIVEFLPEDKGVARVWSSGTILILIELFKEFKNGNFESGADGRP